MLILLSFKRKHPIYHRALGSVFDLRAAAVDQGAAYVLFLMKIRIQQNAPAFWGPGRLPVLVYD
jgi:hypothetical protein